MASIDKLRVKDYYELSDLRNWIISNNPSLLKNMYDPFISQSDWNKWKESIYNHDLEMNQKKLKIYDYNPKLCRPDILVNNIKSYYESLDVKIPFETLFDEATGLIDTYDELCDKECYVNDVELPIANFTFKNDNYLLWRCPLDFIRYYLKKQCGKETKWYHKLFFKN